MPYDCIFCKILQKEAPASIIYQDEICTAFMDIQPVNPGHILVVPNRHASNLSELNPQDGERLFRTAQKMTAALYKSGIRCEGVNFFLADGEAAFQDVFHVHLHVFPRYKADGFRLKLSPQYHTLPERDELNRLANKIKTALELI
jgi:histidine triad (HIT) family protein